MPDGVTASSVPALDGSPSTTTPANHTATTAKNGSIGRTNTTAVRRPTTTSPAAAPNRVQVTAPPSSPPSEPVQPGGTLTALMPSDGNGFDPTKATGNAVGGDMQRMFAVYDALIYQDPRTGNAIPETAESMTTADAKVWLLKIRAGIRFSDGTPYDAAAVKLNWDRHADPKNGSPWAATLKTMTYDIVDPLTLRITLAQPSGQFPRIVSREFSYIASPVGLAAAQAASNDKPVGAGPFVLKSWTPGSQMVLDRNPSYWNAPRPYVDHLVFKVVTDEAQRTAALRAGDGDLDFTLLATTAGDLDKDFQIVQSPSIASTTFYMNLAKPPFNDAAVRKAMQLAIDTDQINKTVFAGKLETPKGFFPAIYPYFDSNSTFPAPNLTEAQKLIDDYINNRNDGNPIEFTFSALNTGPQVQEAQLIQTMVQRLKGVKMNIRSLTMNQFVAEVVQKNFDADALGYTGIDPEPDFDEMVLTAGTRNFQGYSNTAVDKAVADSRATADSAARIQSLKAMQQQLLADMPFFVLNRNPAFWAAKGSIRDLGTFDDGGLLSDRVWIKTR
jgi:peptide/nickel transport system substrate-binding protein